MPETRLINSRCERISNLVSSHKGLQRCFKCFICRHRAASVGSTAFLKLLLNPQLILPDTSSMPKPRLNLQDRAGNTPLHLAIESGHGEAACILIEAGCDRHRTNADGQRAEELDVIGGTEGRKLKAYINDRVGKLSD